MFTFFFGNYCFSSQYSPRTIQITQSAFFVVLRTLVYYENVKCFVGFYFTLLYNTIVCFFRCDHDQYYVINFSAPIRLDSVSTERQCLAAGQFDHAFRFNN